MQDEPTKRRRVDNGSLQLLISPKTTNQPETMRTQNLAVNNAGNQPGLLSQLDENDPIFPLRQNNNIGLYKLAATASLNGGTMVGKPYDANVGLLTAHVQSPLHPFLLDALSLPQPPNEISTVRDESNRDTSCRGSDYTYWNNGQCCRADSAS
jgi:hypothetical protein